jgi:hypothetical protein
VLTACGSAVFLLRTISQRDPRELDDTLWFVKLVQIALCWAGRNEFLKYSSEVQPIYVNQFINPELRNEKEY